MEAIPDDELARSIVAAERLASAFRDDHMEIAALFDLVGVILRAEAQKPNALHLMFDLGQGAGSMTDALGAPVTFPAVVVCDTVAQRAGLATDKRAIIDFHPDASWRRRYVSSVSES